MAIPGDDFPAGTRLPSKAAGLAITGVRALTAESHLGLPICSAETIGRRRRATVRIEKRRGRVRIEKILPSRAPYLAFREREVAHWPIHTWPNSHNTEAEVAKRT
jgi:hypothetical protein